ncbi:MAG: 30S ribosomal protein S8e [Candidatus Woesearchaeota archaeon]|nr:30S ribosomal protein S8e [Candidatus Woesearchaeota archaeon]
MALTQSRSNTKASGGRIKDYRKKKLNELAREPSLTKLGELRKRLVRAMGGMIKQRLLSTDVANVYDPKTKKYVKAKIKTITENPANRHYVRRNIMTKGTIIDTEAGKARITSRPGQSGSVDAVLIS